MILFASECASTNQTRFTQKQQQQKTEKHLHMFLKNLNALTSGDDEMTQRSTQSVASLKIDLETLTQWSTITQL